MKLAVSNIAWTVEEEQEIAGLLQNLGVKYIEIAPTKQWADPTQAPADEIEAYVAFWKSYGIEIVAFQSMLFPRPDLKIFESEENRQETLKYLQNFTRLAGTMGAGVMVFGSPKNRQRNGVPTEEADNIAQTFFGAIGDAAQQNQVTFCIEPNPTDYACDYVTNAEQGLALVSQVNNPGFGLHLDIAGMTLAGDDVQASIRQASSVLRHFHISSPMLDQVEDRSDVNHRGAAAELRSINYSGFVSIEMRPGEAGTNKQRVEQAVRFAQAVYGD